MRAAARTPLPRSVNRDLLPRTDADCRGVLKRWEGKLGLPITLINHADRTDENSVIIVDGRRLMLIAPAERLPDKPDKF